MPEERGEEGEGAPTDEEAAEDRATFLDEPVRVTPVKVVRWVPKAAAPPPGEEPSDGQEAPPGEGAPDEGAPPFAVVEDEDRDEVAPFVDMEGGGESPAPFEVVGTSDEGPAPFEVVGDDRKPAPRDVEGVSFQVVEDQGLLFTEVAEGDEGDEGGPPAPFEEEIEMEPAMELRDEESVRDDAPSPRRPPAPPEPSQAPSEGSALGGPPAPYPSQTPPRTLTGIPIAQPPPLARRAESPAQPARSPMPPPPKPGPPTPSLPNEPGYAKYFRPDEDALRPRDQGPPSGFDRDIETEAGEIDIGIELDRPADKWKRGKAPARPPRDAKKPGQRVVGGRDMDSEVGTRDVGPDIGVSFERRRRRRL